MDHKAWHLRRKSSENLIVTAGADKVVISPLRNFEEEENEIGSEICKNNLSEKLASVLLDCHGKGDSETKKDKRFSPAAVAGIEEDTMMIKKELDDTLSQERAASKKLNNMEMEQVSEPKQQLSCVEVEQEKRICGAVLEKSRERDKEMKKMEEKLKETRKQLASLATENTRQSKALLSKEKLIEDLHKHNSQVHLEFNALMARLDSTEKENTFLKYEFCMLEKELEFRNEELEYVHQSADSSRKHHLDSVKKITMLEAECERLRVFMQKRVPGPTTPLARRKQSINRELIVRRTPSLDNNEITGQKISFLIERLRGMEDENRALKEIICKKSSRLYQVEKCSDDGVSSSGSWANDLMSELEIFGCKKFEQKGLDINKDMSLMDDFVEMEKLAIASVKDLVTVSEVDSCSYNITGNPFDWLQIVLNAMLEQKRISNRSLEELFRDIKIALGFINNPASHEQDLLLLLKEENIKLKDEMKSMECAKNDVEVRLKAADEERNALRVELEILRESNGLTEDQFENQKLANEELDTQLTVTKAELNGMFQKFSSLEVELDDKSNCCEELEATCLELQLQLESMAKKETPKNIMNQKEEKSETGWEITSASAKLAECQETIISLGKQLKALASPRREKVVKYEPFSTSTADVKIMNKRTSLRDKMLAEDENKLLVLSSPKVEEETITGESNKLLSKNDEADSIGSKQKAGAVAIVPSKKQGGFSLLRKLLLRRKKSSGKKSGR